MANQTQKQKNAAARAAAKAAEEAKVATEEANQQEQGTQDPETQAEDQAGSFSAQNSETNISEKLAGIGEQDDPSDTQEEGNAPAKEADGIQKLEGGEDTDNEQVTQSPSLEVSVQPILQHTKVEPIDLTLKPVKEEQPVVAVAKAAPKMQRVDVQTNDVNIETISTEDYFQMKHQYVFGTGSNDLQEVIEFLNRYEDTMARGAVVDERVGVSLQHQLYRNYLRAVTLSGNERNIAMDYILWKFFKNEKSAYRPHYLGRFTRSGKWEIDELKMFNSLNTIFHAISHPLERVLVLREYKLGAIVSKFPQDKARYTEAFLGWTQTYR